MGLSFKHESENLGSGHLHSLSLIIGADYISYVVMGSGNTVAKSNLVLYDNPSFEFGIVDTVLQREGLYDLDVVKTQIAIGTNDYSFVPEPEYEVDKGTLYLLGFENGSIIKNKILSDDFNDIVNVYAAPRKLITLLGEKFENAKIFHSDSALLFGTKGTIQTGVIAHYVNKTLHIFAYKYGNFIYSNRYHIESDLAALYYITSAFEHTELYMDSMPLYLSGDFAKEDDITNLLSIYIKNIEFVKCPIRFTESSTKQSHLYFHHYCLSKCG